MCIPYQPSSLFAEKYIPLLDITCYLDWYDIIYCNKAKKILERTNPKLLIHSTSTRICEIILHIILQPIKTMGRVRACRRIRTRPLPEPIVTNC